MLFRSSQFDKLEGKIHFENNGKDTTEKCINDFAKCTQYFTLGGYSKLLTGEIKPESTDYVDILSEIYDNDLKNEVYENPKAFIIKEQMKYIPLL